MDLVLDIDMHSDLVIDIDVGLQMYLVLGFERDIGLDIDMG